MAARDGTVTPCRSWANDVHLSNETHIKKINEHIRTGVDPPFAPPINLETGEKTWRREDDVKYDEKNAPWIVPHPDREWFALKAMWRMACSMKCDQIHLGAKIHTKKGWWLTVPWWKDPANSTPYVAAYLKERLRMIEVNRIAKGAKEKDETKARETGSADSAAGVPSWMPQPRGGEDLSYMLPKSCSDPKIAMAERSRLPPLWSEEYHGALRHERSPEVCLICNVGLS